MSRRFAALVVVTVLAASSASTARAAAPRILIVSGAALEHQVVIANWQEIFTVVQQVTAGPGVSRAQLAYRPKLRLSMFWGPGWNDYLREGHSAAALRPGQADDRGWFYPAWDGRLALIDLSWAGNWPRVVPGKALAILKRHGVTVRLS
jgi:hypothetical protein